MLLNRDFRFLLKAENGDEKEKRFYRPLGSLARVLILTFST
jgi:hypothetical protein